MNTAPVLNESTIDDALLPNAKELKALRQFVSQDKTRASLCTLWMYASEGGVTHVACDGHTIAVRRSGTHRDMSIVDIGSKLAPVALDAGAGDAKPLPWHKVMQVATGEKLAPAYSFNPAYVARVGDVELAAGHRAAEDFKPGPRDSVKYTKQQRSTLKLGKCATWRFPSDPLAGFSWHIETPAARWEGVVMPRRV